MLVFRRPAYRNHTVLEIARGVKAFLSLAVGITRGEVPDPDALQSRLLATRPGSLRGPNAMERTKAGK